MKKDKTNLLGCNLSEIEVIIADLGYRKFHAKQILKWIHKRYITDIAEMTDLSHDLRDKLSKSTEIGLPALISENVSKDGTIKWLINSGVGQAIETVYIPETDRGTLCISSQVGCALDCSFCATGHQGFNRNLNADEIISQLYFANSSLPRRNNGLPAITNVVFMGMGEPLANVKHVLKAIEIMLSDHAYGLSRRRVTLSTS